jgi:hypothetical protein
LDRVKRSLTPWKNDFFDIARTSPDLYGPFWILTTIIFLLSSTGNLARYFNNWDRDTFIFRLELVRYGVLIVYSFGIGLPVLLGVLFRFFESNVNIFQVKFSLIKVHLFIWLFLKLFPIHSNTLYHSF